MHHELGGIKMKRKILEKYKSLILRMFLGFTVLFWGYEKLNLEKLETAYTMDYENFMVLDVNLFLNTAGWIQILMGLFLFAGLLTRLNAILLTLMGLITIVIPGMVVMKDVPHFAYAFALTGASMALLIEGSGEYSLDHFFFRNKTKSLRFSSSGIPV
jgi:uncharacterized membrane protein YphA (DoxX/SURF4 family)